MPESQLLIGLETSFKNWQKALNVNIYYILKAYIWCYPPPLAYGLYTCENVDIFGWPLTWCNIRYMWYCAMFAWVALLYSLDLSSGLTGEAGSTQQLYRLLTRYLQKQCRISHLTTGYGYNRIIIGIKLNKILRVPNSGHCRTKFNTHTK